MGNNNEKQLSDEKKGGNQKKKAGNSSDKKRRPVDQWQIIGIHRISPCWSGVRVTIASKCRRTLEQL